MLKRTGFGIAGLTLIVALLGGCVATIPPPLYMDPDCLTLTMDTITMLPVIDRRVDKSHEFNIESSIGDRVASRLKKKGYNVERLPVFSEKFDISNDEIAEMENRELMEVAAGGAPYLLAVYIDDALGQTALGYSFKIEATAVLLSRESMGMLWKNKGIGSSGQGGLLGCLMAGMTKGEAMNACANIMMANFPDHPSKRKN